MPQLDKKTIAAAYKRREAAVKAAPDSPYREVLLDGKGLSLTINRNSDGWTYSYKPRGMARVETSPGVFITKRPGSRHIHLGTYKELSIERARDEAAVIRSAVAKGSDPATDHRKAQKQREATTQRAVSNSLLAPYEHHLQTVTSRKTRRTLGSRHIAAELANLRAALDALKIGDIAPDAITTDHIADILTKAKGPTAARHWHGALHRFLAWCQQQRRITVNPARDVPLPPAPPSRSRWLTAEEINAVWHGTDALDPAFRDFVRWLIAIPCRRDEAASLRWPAIDMKTATWSQAAADTKNAQPHRFAINAPAMDILNQRLDAARLPNETATAALKRLTADNALVFASPKTATPISAFSRILSQVHAASKTSGWSYHDCRRSFASHLGEQGLPLDIIDQCLNHAASASRGGVLGVYQRSSRWPQQQAAMTTWGNLLSTFIGQHQPDSNVVSITSTSKSA
jgi:integrase